MSRFRSYSFGNVLEIARQRPGATRVAGMYAWNQLGRRVKKGEKGIRILAPIIGIKRKSDQEAEEDITKQNTRVLVGFRNAYVWDLEQTDGPDLPQMEHVQGDAGENFDHGYAVTSHSSQGLNATRVIINVDTTVHPELLNTRFAYVSVSRAAQDARIFTDDAAALGKRLGTHISKSSALEHPKPEVNHTVTHKEPSMDKTAQNGMGEVVRHLQPTLSP